MRYIYDIQDGTIDEFYNFIESSGFDNWKNTSYFIECWCLGEENEYIIEGRQYETFQTFLNACTGHPLSECCREIIVDVEHESASVYIDTVQTAVVVHINRLDK